MLFQRKEKCFRFFYFYADAFLNDNKTYEETRQKRRKKKEERRKKKEKKSSLKSISSK